MMTHHMAKVLAYTGEPDVIGKILAVMPKGNDDQPGQIDYMYALRVIDKGWSAAEVKITTDWFAKASKWRGGSTFAGHLNQVFDAVVDAFTPEQKQAAYDAAPLFAPLTPTELASNTGGRGGRAGARRRESAGGGRTSDGRSATSRRTSDRSTTCRGGNATAAHRRLPEHRVVAAAAGVAAADRRRSRATCRSIARNATTTSCFREAAGRVCISGRGGGPNVENGKKTFDTVCAKCHRIGTVGNTYGPDLTNIQTMPRRDILRAIFFPNEKVDPKYETTVIVTRDKQTIRGLVISENGQSVTLKTAEVAEPVMVQKSRIATPDERANVDHARGTAGHGG